MKTTKETFIRVWNETYGFNFYLCTYRDVSKFKRAFKLKFDLDFNPKNPDTNASCIDMTVDGVPMVVMWVRYGGSASLVHECVHAVNALMRTVGISADLHNDEPQAYLIEWLFRKCQPYLTH